MNGGIKKTIAYYLQFCSFMLTVSDTAQGAGGAQSFYDGQRSDTKVGLEKQPSKESREQPRTERTETRYENYNLPRTFEGLEQSFHEDIILLSKELQEAEDAENSRHMEVCQMHSIFFLWYMNTEVIQSAKFMAVGFLFVSCRLIYSMHVLRHSNISA
jgi:hypothetical protein